MEKWREEAVQRRIGGSLREKLPEDPEMGEKVKIRILSEETINQIAAGEVIERPSSIAKELLENAVDAGASAISVEIRDGGVSLLRVTDNGSGIAKGEVRTAFLRHATSKIRDASDLGRIRTLGFRGEALASIAAVSKTELITKTPDSLLASRYEIEGGVERSLSEIGAMDGTTVLVRELFYNVPARRKFLKSRKTEGARVQEIVEREAIAHPDIAFRYLQDGKQRFVSFGKGAPLDALYAVYGRELRGQLIPLSGSYLPSKETGRPALRISGFVGKPSTNRSNRSCELFFVNCRHVRSPLLTRALEDGCRAFLMQHKFPFAVVMLELDPAIVDVNVHPQKLEVRFSDGEGIYAAVFDAIERALHETEMIADAEPPKREDSEERGTSFAPEPFERRRMEMTPSFSQGERGEESSSAPFQEREGYRRAEDFVPGNIRENPSFSEQGEKREEEEGEGEREREDAEERSRCKALSGKQESLFSERFLSERARTEQRIIGQLFDTYWLIEYGDKLFLIDQHAAHEKVNFERLMKRFREKKALSQYLSPPIVLTLSSREELILQRYLSYFRELGYEISELGGRDYSVSAVPADLPRIGKKELLLELLDELCEESGRHTAESIYDRIASMSCKAAVKGNMRLSFREMDALLSELMSLENPYACPHGRPTIVSISKTEIERKFKRIL